MIGIFGFNDLHLMQYLYKYTNIFDENGIEYDVVFWNRSEEKYPPNKPASYNKEKRGLYQTSQLLSSCFIGHYRIIRTE